MEDFLAKYGFSSVHDNSEIGMSPLHYAAYEGNAFAIHALVAAGAEVDVRDVNEFPRGGGSTPLWFALRRGHYEAAGALLELRADVSNSSLSAPVITNVLAAAWDMSEDDSLKMLRLVLSNGFDVNHISCSIPNEYADVKLLAGSSMLFCAAHAGKLGAVQLLLEYRADPTQACTDQGAYEGQTPLSAAESGAFRDCESA